VVAFTPAEPVSEPAGAAGPAAGLATMEKHYEGEVEGRSATRFASAPAIGRPGAAGAAGADVVVESFEGSLGGASGSFHFAYSGADQGTGRAGEFFEIVPASGTGELTGIRGAGGMAIDPDGTHRIWFEYELR
jgi:hypothetical protein